MTTRRDAACCAGCAADTDLTQLSVEPTGPFVLKLLTTPTDVSDVDVQTRQESWPEPVIEGHSVAPMLPPQLVHVEQPLVQAPVVTRAYEHTEHHGPQLLGTSATRLLVVAGWTGSVVGYSAAAVSLSHGFRHVTGANWRLAFADIRWLMPLMISAFGMAYLGWVVWATLAAINGHRVAPLASSPMLPPAAYLLGPALALAGSINRPDLNGYWLAGAVVWACVGHGFVLLSLRSSARRIGADSDEFTKLIWFPLASLGYRVIALTVLPTTSFDNTQTFAALVVVDVVLMTSTAVAVWRAMHSFDQACLRDRYSSVENQLPAFMAAAHR
jgi:hypothetical protein